MAAPNLPTLASMRRAVYDKFDENLQDYIQSDEMDRYINEGAAQLYNWLVSESEEYIWAELVGTLDPNTTDFNLPADFMKVLKIYLLPGYQPMKRLMLDEWRGPGYGSPLGYMVVGNYIRFGGPIPPGAQVAFWYVPVYSKMVDDTDTWPFPYVPGWEAYIVNYATIQCRTKEESDTVSLEKAQLKLEALIQADMINRDLGRNRRVVDVETQWQAY